MIDLPRITLASGSPRRVEILESVGWPFERQAADIDECEVAGEAPEDYVVRLAREKALVVAEMRLGEVVLGADTTVVVDGRILGKPTGLDDAKRMLRELSGRSHFVLTGIAVAADGRVETALERTRVDFREMNEDEIEFLAEKGDPLDKAGAYAVQAQAALFISGIDGDYWNVVGLPIGLVYRLIMKKPGV
ncbi:MAG: maf protein [Acidobacteria bacterium OLB17]|nr:MAG: maf protein [Acidobacteria bacterium OLB17]MCZ2391354.1 Maf family protein [Acidobacteriota bacterium]